MLSGGGLTTIETACRFPIRLVESGPAGGAIFSAHDRAANAGCDSVLSFDMGGTTAKICLIDDFRPQTARSFEVARVGRFRKGIGPAAAHSGDRDGGDRRRRRLDRACRYVGRIAVGPESAGADPGPACYGRGGTQPAVTDANLVLGRYDPARFAGGTMQLDAAARARRRWWRDVGAPLGLDGGHGGARRGRDGRREHGQRRARARDRVAARPTTGAR